MMDTSLVERNTKEIITRDELHELLKKNPSPITYCGYEVSGPVHIGTFVAIQKQVDFQNAGFKVKVLLADLHTFLNRKGDEKFIEEQLVFWKNTLTKAGLNKAEFVKGTDFQFDENYIRDVLTLGLKTSLMRARRSMQEVARDLENARVSQMIYPLMQIADIKALDVDVAHGGLEQRKIHMLARELLPELGYKNFVCVHTPLLASLQGPEHKMSSSKPETIIAVDEAPESISKKVSAAFCPPEKDGNPVLQMCEYIIFPKILKLEVKRKEKFGGDVTFSSYTELESAYVDKKLHPQDLKNAVADTLIEILEPMRK